MIIACWLALIEGMNAELIGHAGRFHGGPFALLFMLAFLALVGLAIAYFVRRRRATQGASTTAAAPQPAPVDHAMEALRMRLAQGEISPEEFLERSSVLATGDPTTDAHQSPTT